MHPITLEYLAKAHIRDLRPARTWPDSDLAGHRTDERAGRRVLEAVARRVSTLRRLKARLAAS